MAFINFVEWNPTSNSIFAYKYPENNLSTLTQLVVRESQEAVLFSKGKMIGKFGPGKHTLNTENLPLLRNLYGIPFGGKNPFTAEVWFVNKTVPLNIDWKTSTMRFLDPEYNAMMPIFAEGRYGLKVVDAERFLIKLVGTLTQFTSAELTDHFMGELITKTKSVIVSFMTSNGVGINYISQHLDELSGFIGQPLREFWENYGFNLEGFYINTVDIDTSTPDGKKISEALSDRSAQGIAGYTWQQKQTFEVAEKAAGNGGGMSGLLAAAMLSGGFGGNGSMGGAMMQPSFNQGVAGGQYGLPVATAYEPQNRMPKEIFCAKCGKKRAAGVMFCPACGKKLNRCPACGADNLESAKRCTRCGTTLQNNDGMYGDVCPRCGTPIDPGAKFCTGCGKQFM